MSAFCQRPAYQKMSSLVREACRDAADKDFVHKAPADKPSVLTAFVKLNGSSTDALERHGCKVLARYGSLCVASIPLPAISSLSLDDDVIRIEAGRRATALMDTTSIIVGAEPVRQGIGLPQSYTGKGVVVGAQDIGFDLTHPTFWSSDMSTYRIKAMWDQLSYDTLTSRMPVGRDYVGQEELLAVGHPRDGMTQTHGTHTAGIAAGSGAEGGGTVSPYVGIAPDADIIMVCNATSDDASLIDPKDYYKYTYALDALGFKYMFDYADRVGKPCVINFSEGSRMDFRGDDQLYYEMLDSLSGPGHIIVASAGNSGRQFNHVRKTADMHSAMTGCYMPQYPKVVTTRTSANDFTLRYLLFKDSVEIVKDLSFNRVLNSPDSTLTDTLRGNGIVCPITATAYRSCFNSSDLICDWQLDRDSLHREDGWNLDILLIGDGQDVEMFPSNCIFTNSAHITQRIDADYSYGVNSPGSAPSVICVGSTGYRPVLINHNGKPLNMEFYSVSDGELMPTSSIGPTYDERIKPDVMAPGLNIVSAYSSFFEEGITLPDGLMNDIRLFDYNNRKYAWHALSGTSMASPVVAGVIALWLQAYPKLTAEDCKEIFAATCTHHDPSLSYPNNSWGYGQIDAAAGMKLVLEKAAAGINDITSDKKQDNRIFTIDGRYAGTDMSKLPKGIYIRNGLKVIKLK